jgi:hypothetical protein
MRMSSRAIWVFSVLGLLAGAARAEIPAGYTDRTPAQLARDTFDSDYGRLLVAELGKILRESADAECLRSRAINAAVLEARAGDLLVRNATRFFQIGVDLIDPAKFEAAIAERAGSNVRAELVALRADPDVRKYLELSEPATLAKLADQVAEQIDRHALLRQIKLKRALSPLGTGNIVLLQANEDLSDKAERFLDGQTSARFKRWLEIHEAIAEALDRAADRETLLRMGPIQMTPGAEADFAELCVFTGRR